MTKLFSRILLAGAVAVLVPVPNTVAQSIAHRGLVRRNASGGVTASRATALAGDNGGRAVHARAVATDSAGDVSSARGSAFSGPEGTRGARGASNTVSANGTATHRSGSVVQGP